MVVLEKIIAIFEEIGLPYRRQGTYGEYEEYPSSFFTYWNIQSPYKDYGDCIEHTTTHEFMIYHYSLDESELHSNLELFISKAKALGFIITGKGQDVNADDKRFVGRAIRIYFRENMEEK